MAKETPGNDDALPNRDAADILIVDDTPANLKLLSMMLKERCGRIRAIPAENWRCRSPAALPTSSFWT